jgi:amidohydrolase
MDSRARNSYLADMRAKPFNLDVQLDELAALRHQLHQQPELSTREERTASLIVAELEQAGADEVLAAVGGTGVVGVFDSGQPGPTLVLRCELDALPISEPEDFGHEYRSQSEGVSHKCGHDGHMAILIGVARALGRQRPAVGKVALLFQPAEETGEGAPAVLADARFKALEPDFIIGFHNLPRHAMHSICLRENTFASASEGFRLQLTGAFSHSSYPEHGRSPAVAVAELLAALPGLPGSESRASDLLMLTITQAVLGEKGPKLDFGVAPGVAEICGVIRAHRQHELDALKQAISGLAGQVCEREELSWKLSWHEAFPATVNHDASVALIRDAAAGAGLNVELLDEPFRWSEDFGHYLQQYPGAFFGIGSGVDQPQLHNEYYDFPDELISTGVTVYLAIVGSILGT